MRASRAGRAGRAAQQGHWAWWVAPASGLVLAWLLWSVSEAPRAAAAPAAAPAGPAAVASAASVPPRGWAAGRALAGAPYSAAGLQAREAQLQLWQLRLERARASLEGYRAATRYPHESRPIAEHPDQVHPNEPITEEHALRSPDGKLVQGVKLSTSQERVFVQGQESVRFTVAVRDEAGAAQPLRVLRAAAREVPAPNTASYFPVLPVEFNDEGAAGDATAGDRVFSTRLQPASQGFARLAGAIRVEVFLEYRGQQGATYFDIFYTPEPPATWAGGVREAMEDGSLNFYLKAQVREPGRYVVTARVDDATGKPFALLTFNDEVAAGAQEFRLGLFGKLVRDGKPAFPLALRDVEALLLRPDTFPDRSLMPRRAGKVHTSAVHALASFADAEWSGEERTRYLAELNRDLQDAQQHVNQLEKGP
ncbi:choice-of-anchor X domain-containing protein [Ideonella sp. BN130291]|uniref:choice-of-anchor X domain-containing protein n=1 Tax=Ideonella sp. BN130291 TaxID=3112940 RepID=UPI002E253EF8|nr:choice-of-anchor X domain-containing protein [Ideonella sp. BN130291]